MLKITLETELRSVNITVPNFNAKEDTELFEYIWEMRNILIAYGFQQRYIDDALGLIIDDEDMVDSALDELDEKKKIEIN